MKYLSPAALIILCVTAVTITTIVADAIRPVPVEAPAKAADPDITRLVSRISDLERELGHREAECDALADQLDSAVAELNAAGALLEKHGLKLHDDSNLIEQ